MHLGFTLEGPEDGGWRPGGLWWSLFTPCSRQSIAVLRGGAVCCSGGLGAVPASDGVGAVSALLPGGRRDVPSCWRSSSFCFSMDFMSLWGLVASFPCERASVSGSSLCCSPG